MSYNSFIINILEKYEWEKNNISWNELEEKVIFNKDFVDKINILANENLYAMNFLGNMFYYGKGVYQDYNIALE